MKHLLILLTVSLLGLLTVYAQESVDDQGNPNDPHVNDRANACYAGAAWEDKCGDDLYMWTAGWYYIRLQAGIFGVTDIPYDMWWMIPSDGSTGGGSSSPTFSVCKEYYILLGHNYYTLFDSPTGDTVTDGDLFWMDDPTCGATAPLVFSGWKVAFAPGGLAQANVLCGAAPIRQHSADIFICQGA